MRIIPKIINYITKPQPQTSGKRNILPPLKGEVAKTATLNLNRTQNSKLTLNLKVPLNSCGF